MIDLQQLRRDAASVAARLAARGFAFDLQGFEALESRRKTVQTRTEGLQARRNALSKAIGQAKAKGESAEQPMAEVAAIADALAADSAELAAIQAEIGRIVLSVPNLPHETVPTGAIGRRQPRGPTLGRARDFRLRAQGSRRHRPGAGPGLRDRGQAVGRAVRRHARPGRATASRAGAVDARAAHHPSRLRGVRHPLSRQPGIDAGHGPAAEVRGGSVQGPRAATPTRCT